MTFPNDGTYAVKNEYSDEEISPVLVESRLARKHSRKLGRVMDIVADHRLQQLKHFQAREQLLIATYGYDRIAHDDDSWALHPALHRHKNSPPACGLICLQELKEAISMFARDRSRQRAKRFIQELKQATVSMNLTDAELAMLKRFVEERDRDTAHVTAAPADPAPQYRSPRSLTPEIPPDKCVHMEKKEAGMMDPEQDQLESPPAGMGLETPGQQCHPNG